MDNNERKPYSYILGTMNIKYPHSSNTDKSIDSYKEIINYYSENYNNLILDTAYYYGNTETEIILGQILKDINNTNNIKIATKANPWFENDFTNGKYGQLSKTNLERQLNTSLHNLGRQSVDYFYLHCYDYETDLKETLETCDNLWRIEKFDKLGISNFSLRQMEDAIDICEINGYNVPRYYQGMYNLMCRKVENIFDLLSDYNIEFWAYNPLAGGLLTGKYSSSMNDVGNSRFSNDNNVYRNIFWKPELLKNINEFVNDGECLKRSYQWLRYNSKLRANDKIIMGVSTLDQLKSNTQCLNERRCIMDIRKINRLYKNIENISPNYYY